MSSYQLDSRRRIYDALLVMKSAGAVTSSAQATVDGTTQYIDTGGGTLKAALVVDVSSIYAATLASNNTYQIQIRGSNTATGFSTVGKFNKLAELSLGAPSTAHGGVMASAATPSTGRYVLPFSNEFGATTYRYLMVYHYIAGTGSTINYSAFISKDV